MITVTFKRFAHAEGLPTPRRHSEGASGIDLMAALPFDEDTEILPGERALIPTGFAIDLPIGYEAQVRPRSGLALKDGISVLNSPGTIDADYRGEIGVLLVNFGKRPFSVARGARIAQLIVSQVEQVLIRESDHLTESVRGDSGFGSTGFTDVT